MRSEDDRRARGASRIPFEGLVEVGGAVGPSFEAQAIDVSEQGMQLRTAYLPDLGQRLSCRFDAGPTLSVLASGEVVWRHEEGRGGEFGLRFDDLDAESIEALRSVTGAATRRHGGAGSKVRLHIEGLGSPMRARVKESKERGMTVGSELNFLQVGKELELEDAGTGEKRPARIDRVDVELDAASKIPNLVVALRYSDVEDEIDVTVDAKAPTPAGASAPVAVAAASSASSRDAETAKITRASKASAKDDDDDLEAIRRASGGVKGAFARSASQFMPAVTKLAKRAQVTAALLAERARGAAAGAGAKDDMEAPARRTTAPAPGGGLHTSGRKVVRGDSMTNETDDVVPAGVPRVDKRKLMIGGAIGAALILTAIAMRKPATPPVASSPATEGSASPLVVPATSADPAALAAIPPVIPAAAAPAPMTMPPVTITPEPTDLESADGARARPAKRLAVTPFGNGPVSHGNVLKLKMDGAIERIDGASQPTGFTVVIPNRRSLEAAGPLAARDSRIASIRVTNEGSGAELAVTFKDGVPNYQVRGKGDTLEIALASVGPVADTKPEKAEKTANARATSHPKHAEATKHGKKRHKH